ncbi:MAG: hypothetical protein IPL46_14730 [Saprospiraceae bacterium]|nr:hypothetical protein [Saprospiraceae bacterium]
MRIILVITVFLLFKLARADVFVVIYATSEGKTGHCGIAVEDYQIRIEDIHDGPNLVYRRDSVKTGTLTYYDLWPKNNDYKNRYDGDVESEYFKLPSSRWKGLISLRTLSDQGLPHKFGYGCNAIVRIPCERRTDFQVVEFLDSILDARAAFNAMKYNCCDFVVRALNYITDRELNAREFVIKDYVTTPNKLYQVVSSWNYAEVIKDPGSIINGSFMQERIFGRLMSLLAIF